MAEEPKTSGTVSADGTARLTWKHVAQNAIEAFKEVGLRLIDRGEAGTVLGLQAIIGAVAVVLLVVLRLPEGDVAQTVTQVAASSWALTVGILVTALVLALWTLRVRTHAMHRRMAQNEEERLRYQAMLSTGKARGRSVLEGTGPCGPCGPCGATEDECT